MNAETLTGNLKISEDVLETIARLATMEIPGVEGLKAPSLSLRDMIVRGRSKNAIAIDLNGDVAEIGVSVVIRYGYRITDIAESIQESVKSAVQNMTGIAVAKVNVIVAGVSFKAAQAQ